VQRRSAHLCRQRAAAAAAAAADADATRLYRDQYGAPTFA